MSHAAEKPETGGVPVIRHHLQKYCGRQLSDEQAQALWEAVRAWLLGAGLESTIQEVLASEASLDTLPRGDMLEALAQTLVGQAWPCYGDGRAASERFGIRMQDAMAARGYALAP